MYIPYKFCIYSIYNGAGLYILYRHISTLGVGSFEDGSVTFQSVSKTRQRLAPIKILMVDEISMLGAKMLH